MAVKGSDCLDAHSCPQQGKLPELANSPQVSAAFSDTGELSRACVLGHAVGCPALIPSLRNMQTPDCSYSSVCRGRGTQTEPWALRLCLLAAAVSGNQPDQEASEEALTGECSVF